MTTKQPTTNDLWTAAHTALCEKRWSAARRWLDQLGQRSDNHDRLASAASYGVPAKPVGLVAVLQDRIDLVNALVELRLAG